MHILFVHQNFPAQFRHIAPRLAAQGFDCTFVTANTQVPAPPGVRKVIYKPFGGAHLQSDPVTHHLQDEHAHARGVFEAMKATPDVRPDLIVAHSGFGSSLFLPLLYDAPIINFFEYYFGSNGQHLGYRPDTPVTEQTLMRSRLRNACFLLDLQNCDRGWCPNRAQRDTLPVEYHPKTEVIPEGIDTDFWKPGPRTDGERRLPDGTVIPAGTRLVTYVARGLERMRGFDIFMQAAQRIYQQFPNAMFVVVGSDKAHYGNDKALIHEKSLREHVLASGDYDRTKFRFTGRVNPQHLSVILGQSDLHIYLTEPFVTSWSLLDAMSCGCIVLASDQTCVREYITHGQNGLLADFFDVEGLADQAIAVLADPAPHRSLGDAARRTILEHGYALTDTLPRLRAFFEDVAARPRTPSARAELVVRAGSFGERGGVGLAGGAKERLLATELIRRGAVPAIPFGDGALTHDAGTSADGDVGVPRGHIGEGKFAMKKIFFAWELGAGLGHIMELAPLVNGLARQGHLVYVAMREMRGAYDAFDPAVHLLSAPTLIHSNGMRRPTRNFPDLLTGLTFCDERTLAAHAEPWRGLYELIGPDVIVFDHSPTAMLAARAVPSARRVVVGNGFLIPPDISPMPYLRPWAPLSATDEQSMRTNEETVLKRANSVLRSWEIKPLERIGQLYSEVDLTLMMTFKELDPYAAVRPAETKYLGAVNATGGGVPQWPDVRGKRVFAYLRGFPALPQLLRYLGERAIPTIAFIAGGNAGLGKQFNYPTLRFEAERLDLGRIGKECDVAILNGNLGTSSAMLLAGRAALHLPEHLEHSLNARAVGRLGAGLVAPTNAAGLVIGKLETLLAETPSRCKEAAAGFAVRHLDFDTQRQAEEMLGQVGGMLEAA